MKIPAIRSCLGSLKRINAFVLVPMLASMLLVVQPEPAWAKSSLSQAELSRLIVEEAMEAGVEPELALAVARVESNFDPEALSHAGARGVMQIMPATARDEFGVPRYRLYDPQTNIRIGVRYLRQLLDRYDDEALALSHYNGGSRVRQKDGTLAVIPATRDYVNKVLAQKARYANHSLVLAAKQGRLEQRNRRLAQADLDDFGTPVTRPSHRVLHPVSEAKTAPWVALDDERSDLVRALKSLKFKNQYRAISRPELDDF